MQFAPQAYLTIELEVQWQLPGRHLPQESEADERAPPSSPSKMRQLLSVWGGFSQLGIRLSIRGFTFVESSYWGAFFGTTRLEILSGALLVWKLLYIRRCPSIHVCQQLRKSFNPNAAAASSRAAWGTDKSSLLPPPPRPRAEESQHSRESGGCFGFLPEIRHINSSLLAVGTQRPVKRKKICGMTPGTLGVRNHGRLGWALAAVCVGGLEVKFSILLQASMGSCQSGSYLWVLSHIMVLYPRL